MKLEGIYALIAVIFTVTIVAILVLIALLLITKRFRKIIAGKDGVVFSNDKTGNLESIDKRTSNDGKCFSQFCSPQKWILNIGRVMTILIDIHRTGSKLVQEQMDYTEQQLLSVKNDSLDFFVSIAIEESNIEDSKIYFHDAYKSYDNLLFIIFCNVKDKIRYACLDNHFVEKNEREWEQYKNDKVEYIVASMNKDMNNLYSSTSLVTVKCLKEKQKGDRHNKIVDQFYEIFDNLKNKSLNNLKCLENLDKELNQLTYEICGVNAELPNRL